MACSVSGFESIRYSFMRRLKFIIYATLIEHAEILRNRIEQGFRQIREAPGMIERVTRSMTRRVQACLQMQDGHFKHLL